MNYMKTLTCILTLCASSGFGATVDFENELSVGTNDAVQVATGAGTYVNGGITFSSGDGQPLFLVGSGGGAPNAFVPNDTVTPVGSFGNVFLTGDFINNSAMNLSFGKLSNISFDIADIDGSGNSAEQFTFKFFDGATEVGSIFRQSNVSPTTTGDGAITNISFSGLFDSVQITNRTVLSATGSNRNIGWGIDNIETTPVPVPAAAVLLVTALGGLGLMRRRKRAS